MKLILIMILLLVTTGQSSSCGKNIPPNKESAPEEKSAPLNNEFTLKYGQTIEIKEEKLKIKFASVAQDSRCPQGEQCISAGNASITLDVKTANNTSTSVTLNTANEPQELIFQGLGIRLVDLQPNPKSGVDLNHNDYVITLKVYKQT